MFGLDFTAKLAEVEHFQETSLKLLGQQVVRLRISGFEDADLDGSPEFLVDLDLPGEAFDVKDKIEIPIGVALKGGEGLIGHVVKQLVENGHKLPSVLLRLVGLAK